VLTVRPAVAADAPAIARVHVASWREAYRGIIPQQVLDELDEAEWAARHRAHVPPGSGELHALYAHPSAWGTGAGRALTGAALDALRADGCDEAVVWVLDDNRRGRRFYELAGFTLERSGVPLGEWEVSQSRYRKRL